MVHGGSRQVGGGVSGCRDCRPVLGVFLGLGVSLGLGHASSLGGAGGCGMCLVLGSVPRFGLCCPVFLVWGCCQVGGATETCACDQRRGVSRAARGPLPPGWLGCLPAGFIPAALARAGGLGQQLPDEAVFAGPALGLLACLRSAQFKIWLRPCCLFGPSAGSCLSIIAQRREFNPWPGAELGVFAGAAGASFVNRTWEQ